MATSDGQLLKDLVRKSLCWPQSEKEDWLCRRPPGTRRHGNRRGRREHGLWWLGRFGPQPLDAFFPTEDWKPQSEMIACIEGASRVRRGYRGYRGYRGCNEGGIEGRPSGLTTRRLGATYGVLRTVWASGWIHSLPHVLTSVRSQNITVSTVQSSPVLDGCCAWAECSHAVPYDQSRDRALAIVLKVLVDTVAFAARFSHTTCMENHLTSTNGKGTDPRSDIPTSTLAPFPFIVAGGSSERG